MRSARKTVLAGLAVVLALVRADIASPEPLLSERIPPQELSSALELACKQAGLQLVYTADLSDGLYTEGADPGQTLGDTLRQLLERTGLGYEFVNPHTITILPLSIMQQRDARFPSASDRAKGMAYSTSPQSRAEVTVKESRDQFGMPPVGAQIITLTRREIARTNATTVPGVLSMLSQNFRGAPNEATRIFNNPGMENLTNFSFATGANLRGLGSGSTLVLVNGRRLAPGSAEGRFVDIGGIPLSAIDRIEIVMDGASAIYGADAVGGVINFILREGHEGWEVESQLGAGWNGEPMEALLAPLWGTKWNSGKALISLQLQRSGALEAAERRLTASSDLTHLGGDNFNIPYGNPATLTDGQRTWAIPRGQDGRDLTAADLIADASHSFNFNEGLEALPEHERFSIVGTIDKRFGEKVDLFAEALVSRRHSESRYPQIRQLLLVPGSNAFYVDPDPETDSPLFVLYGFGADFGPVFSRARVDSINGSVGLRFPLARSWRAELYGSYASSEEKIHIDYLIKPSALAAALASPDRDSAFNPFGDGSYTSPETLALIRGDSRYNRTTELESVNLTAQGTVFTAAGGDVQLAAGADFQQQSLQSHAYDAELTYPDKSPNRHISAAYAEVLVPVVGERNKVSGIEDLQLSLAGRYERYSDIGEALTPKVGVSWSPFKDFSLRSSWSSSFRAPALLEMKGTDGFSFDTFVDPRAPDKPVTSVVLFGANPGLRQESAKSWSFGGDLHAPSLDLDVSVTYFSIDFKNRVERVAYTPALLSDPGYSDLVTRHPTVDQLREACDADTPFGNPADCLTLPFEAIIDLRYQNVAAMHTSGIDLSIRHELRGKLGTLSSALSSTYILNYARAPLKGSPFVELRNTPGYPVDLRLRGALQWDFRGLGINVYANYTDHYKHIDPLGGVYRKVRSWTTVDLQISYDTSDLHQDLFGNTVLSLGVQNLGNQEPPFFNNPVGIGYDPANADVLGRVLSVKASRQW